MTTENADDTPQISRRAAFAPLGLGAAALGLAAGFSGIESAEAAEMTAEEKANAQTVAAFFKAWGGAAPNAEKLAMPIAEECFVTVNPGPPAPFTSRKAVADGFKPFLVDGTGFDIVIHQTVAKGPAVYVTRTDYTMKDGKRVATDAGTPAVGLFVLKDGMIKYWHDYAFTKA